VEKIYKYAYYIPLHSVKGSQKTRLMPLASIDQRTKKNLNQTVHVFFGDVEPSAAAKVPLHWTVVNFYAPMWLNVSC